jgi:hypothetical protein
MVGSTFGVAALGAIIASVGRSQLATRLPELPSPQRGKLVDLLGSGASTSHLPAHVQGALNDTYVYALSKGLYALGALALAGAVLSLALVRRGAAAAPADTPVVPADLAPSAVAGRAEGVRA